MDKRRSRNLSEKKRRDQFNSLINDLGSHLSEDKSSFLKLDNGDGLTDVISSIATPITNVNYSTAAGYSDDRISLTNTSNGNNNSKLDKSSVLKAAIDFLKKHEKFNTSSPNDDSNNNSNKNNIQSKSSQASYQQDNTTNMARVANTPLTPGISGTDLHRNNNNNINQVNHQLSSDGLNQLRYVDCLNSSDQFPMDTAPWKPTFITDDEFSVLMLEALDAFILVSEVSNDAKILYASDSVMTLLDYKGLKSCTSHNDSGFVSIYDLIAPSDRRLIENLLNGHVQNQGFTNEKANKYVSLMINFRNGLNLNNIKSNKNSSPSELANELCKTVNASSNNNPNFAGQAAQFIQESYDNATCFESTLQTKKLDYPQNSSRDTNLLRDLNTVSSKNEIKSTQSSMKVTKSKQYPKHLQRKHSLHQQRQHYELIRLMGTFKIIQPTDSNTSNSEPIKCFICIGRLEVPRPSYDLKIITSPISLATHFPNNQFVSRHTLKWKFLWLDERALPLIGYLPFEVLGTSGYDYYHWDDLDKVVNSHEALIKNGQGATGPYRFLTKGQQWIWLQTKYSMIIKSRYITSTHSLSDSQEEQGDPECNEKTWNNQDNTNNDKRVVTENATSGANNQNSAETTRYLDDKFECILCTHTVIGFDEDENHMLLLTPTLQQQQCHNKKVDSISYSERITQSINSKHTDNLNSIPISTGYRTSLNAEPPPSDCHIGLKNSSERMKTMRKDTSNRPALKRQRSLL